MKNFLFLLFFSSFLLVSCSDKPFQSELNLTLEQQVELQDQITQAEAALKQARAEKSGSIADNIVNLSSAYKEMGKFDEAIQNYEENIKAGYDSIVILNNLGRLYEKIEDYDQAIKTYQKIVDEHGNLEYLHDIALTYAKAEDYEKAEIFYKKWQAYSKSSDTFLEADLKENL